MMMESETTPTGHSAAGDGGGPLLGLDGANGGDGGHGMTMTNGANGGADSALHRRQLEEEEEAEDKLVDLKLDLLGHDDDDGEATTNLNPGASFDGVRTTDVPILSASALKRGGAAADDEAGVGDSGAAEGGTIGAGGGGGGAGAGGGGGTLFHPDYMFCGECTGCAAPPPPTLRSSLRQRRPRAPPTDLEMANMAAGGKGADDDDDDDDAGFENDPSDVDLEGNLDVMYQSPTSRSRDDNTSHKSRIRITNLTTPGQILVINSILEPVRGVTKLVTNLSDQTVNVYHDPLIVSVRHLVSSLRDMGYDATVSRDGALDLVESEEPHGVCRSTLYVSGICCASEVPAVTSILRGLGRGVMKVGVNITARTVYVDHDPFVCDADMLCRALNRERFGARIKRDGGRNLPRGGQPGAGGGQPREEAAKVKPLTIGTRGRSAFAVTNKRAAQPSGTGGGGDSTSGLGLTADDVRPIQAALSAVPGVTKIGINVQDSIVYVDHDTAITNAEDLVEALETAGTGGSAARRRPYAVACKVDAGRELRRLKEQQKQRHQQRPSSSSYSVGGPSPPTDDVEQLGIRRSKYVESTLVLPSLTTLDAVKKLERIMRNAYNKSEVRAFYPHVPSRTVKVEHDPNLVGAPDVRTLLSSDHAGFDDVRIDVDGAVENLALPEIMDSDDHDGALEGKEHGESSGGGILGGLHVSVILSGICWFVSMLSIVDGWEYLQYAGIASVVLGMPSVTMKAWRTIRRWQFDANCMMVVAAFGALCLGEFDEAASVAFLFAVSEWLEARASAKARRALGAIVSLRPEHANLINRSTGEVTIVPASSIPVGSHVSVRTGDKIPADGIVEEGTSTVDESSLTGEAKPVSKRPEDAVSGGSINVGVTRLVVRTTSTVDDSAVSRLIRLVEEAQANRSPTEKLVDSFARAYTPIVVAVAALMCTVPWFWGSEVGRYWTLNGLIIIVIACPCALTISTPVTYAAGLAATAQRGIIVKGGARLEALGNVRKVVFDKTGTVTEGKFTLIHLESVGEARSRKQLLELLALMEAPSSHPLSATLVNAAKKEGVDASADVNLTDHTILKGEGVTARVDNENVYVGNVRLFERLGLYDSLETSRKRSADSWSRAGGTVGFVGIQGVGIIGMFCVSDRVREEAKDVVQSLQRDGFEVMMLTGDSDGAAKAVGREVGLPVECVHSHLMPEDKLHFIGSVRGMGGSKQPIMCGSKELVLMCGDGVNDAPALAVADVGVAMGEGAALAMEMSDVTLMDSNLTKLTFSIKMGSRVINTIRENIILSLVAKIVVVGLTFAGKMTLLWAIASDVGIMLAVTLNGMKLLPGRERVSLKAERVATVKRGRGGTYNELLPVEGQRTNLPDIM